MSHVKINNRSLILKQLKVGPLSRKDIAERSGLTPAAVTILVNELIEQGCVQEAGHINEPGRVGRKKVVLELNNHYKHVVGVNIEGHQLSLAIGNITGDIEVSQELVIQSMKPDEVLSLVVEKTMEMIWNMNLTKKDILGLGVGIVGIVDKAHRKSIHAYGLWKEEVDIADRLTKELDLPVIVANNVRSLALAEIELTSHRKLRNLVFVKEGPGLGSAIILNKEIYPGSYNNSGEIGHMIVDIDGKPCRCGQKGCLETVASMGAVIDDIKNEYSQMAYPLLADVIHNDPKQISEEALIKAYHQGDKKVVQKLDAMFYYLSIGLVNVLKFYDPHKLVLYGKVFKDKEFIQILIDQLEARGDFDQLENRVEASSLTDSKAIGGLILVVTELFYKTGAALVEE